MKVKAMQVGEIGTNCYILEDETAQVCAVIDPGGNPEQIISVVETSGCKPCAILLTHGHYDHTNGVAALQKKWPDIPVYLNQRDVYTGDAYLQTLFPLIPNTSNYDEGDVIPVGNLKVSVMATPGHSEGSVTLRCGDILFCGDTLFYGSCGRTDFPGGSVKKILASLRRLGELEGDLPVCPGHMDTSTLDAERKINPYLRQAMDQPV